MERTQWHFLVPLVPLVSHIPRNGTEQDAGIRADFVPLLHRIVSAVSGAIQAIQPIHGRISLENLDDFCSICSTCPPHSVERNGTRPMVWADRYGRSAPVTGESGQSQFAPLKLRSLALVPSSGAQCAPTNSTYGSSTVRLFLPSALKRSSQRLTAVPRPGFAGPDARGIRRKERCPGSKVGARKRSACGRFISTRRVWRLPAYKRELEGGGLKGQTAKDCKASVK